MVRAGEGQGGGGSILKNNYCDVVIYNKKNRFCLCPISGAELLKLNFLSNKSNKGILICITNPCSPHLSLLTR